MTQKVLRLGTVINTEKSYPDETLDALHGSVFTFVEHDADTDTDVYALDMKKIIETVKKAKGKRTDADIEAQLHLIYEIRKLQEEIEALEEENLQLRSSKIAKGAMYEQKAMKLFKRFGRLTTREIADELNVSKPLATNVLRRLVEQRKIWKVQQGVYEWRKPAQESTSEPSESEEGTLDVKDVARMLQSPEGKQLIEESIKKELARRGLAKAGSP